MHLATRGGMEYEPGDLNIVKYLVANNADVDIVDHFGKNPLSFAAHDEENSVDESVSSFLE